MYCFKRLTTGLIMAVVMLVLGAGSGICVTPVKNCTDLESLAFTDDAFNKPITITSAKIITATSTVPEYCEVKGTIWPEIAFVIALPTTGTPNANLYQVGGGAWGGSLPSTSTLAPGLQLGYTAVGNNGGHDVVKEPGGSFAWNNPDGSNPNYLQKVKDFGYRANVETNLLARKLIKSFYGVNASRAYWVGCSQGGREGQTLAQKYPDLWDGFVTGAPAPGVTWLCLRGLWNSQWGTGPNGFTFAPGKEPPNIFTGGTFSTATLKKMQVLANVVYAKCDSIDGLVDGFIDDPRKCNFDATVDLLPYACANDVDVDSTPACFTSGQRTALKKMYEGAKTSAGKQLFPGLGMSAEYIAGDPTVPFNYGFTIALYDRNSPSFAMYVGDGAPGPGWSWRTFNWDTDWLRYMPQNGYTYGEYWDQAVYVNGKIVPAMGGLAPLKARGGKIIHYHGLGDVMSPTSSMFYDTILETMGRKETENFYKLYLVPGMGHCFGGIGCYNGDTNLWFKPLVDWVENGVEPGALAGTRAANGSYYGARTRPLCPYPQVTRYSGTGSIDEAANFTCVETRKARVEIKPSQISLADNKRYFTAYINLPHQGDWRAVSAVCEGALATGKNLVRHGNGYKATFKKVDLKNVTPTEKMAFAVTLFVEHQGRHHGNTDKTPVAFEGTDMVKVVE